MSEPFIGEITQFGGNFAPRGWALCDGQLLAINSHSALFSILGTTYGGDGRTTFGLPDLRGRFAMHAGNGPGLPNHDLGQKSGRYEVTITTAQLPSHRHNVNASNQAGTTFEPASAIPAKGAVPLYSTGSADTTMKSSMVSNTGGGQPVQIYNPHQVVNFIIALEGTFPPRN